MNDTFYFSHPEILIGTPIWSSKNLRIHPKLGGIIFHADKIHTKKLIFEKGSRVLIRILLTRGKMVFLMSEVGCLR